jgi:hypothetical protein
LECLKMLLQILMDGAGVAETVLGYVLPARTMPKETQLCQSQTACCFPLYLDNETQDKMIAGNRDKKAFNDYLA